jgi:hypothetical protein
MKNTILYITAVCVVVVLLFCCENPGYYEGGEGVGGDDVPRYTIDFEEQDDGKVLFFTNEDLMLGPVDHDTGKRKGTTQWRIGTTVFETVKDFTVKVKKVYGNSDGGYGVIISAQNKYNFYAVFINTQSTTGYYKIGKTTAGTFAPFDEWKPSDKINSSPGVKNTIRISYDDYDKRYWVYFNNDTQGIWFEDKDKPFPARGKYGYICEVDGEENFPGTPVEAWYEQVEPPEIGL